LRATSCRFPTQFLIFLCVIFVTPQSFLFADEVLRNSKLYNSKLGEEINTTLAPDNAELQNLLSKLFLDIKPGFIVESLYSWEKPVLKQGSWGAQKLALANELAAISSLKGLEYISPSRKKFRTLYSEAATIDSAKTKSTIPDIRFTELPKEKTVYAMLTDLTFGRNVYEFNFLFSDGSIIVTQRNASKVIMGIFPLADAGQICSVVAVFDSPENLIVYCATFTKVPNLSALKEKMSNSLSARTDAMLEWFKTKAEKVFSLRENIPHSRNL
jgi:hypothetical protein